MLEKVKAAFEKAGIQFCIMKGFAAAQDFPVPDVRKLSDLDILLPDPEALPKAKQVLEAIGFTTQEEQYANHHLCMREPGGKLIEIHNMLAEPFDDAKVNIFFKSGIACGRCIIGKHDLILGRIPKKSGRIFSWTSYIGS